MEHLERHMSLYSHLVSPLTTMAICQGCFGCLHCGLGCSASLDSFSLGRLQVTLQEPWLVSSAAARPVLVRATGNITAPFREEF